MKILVTGADGQLGSELIRTLSLGYTQIGALPGAYAGCEAAAVDLPELDIADGQAVMAYIKGCSPDIIINCAAMTDVDACESDAEGAYRANAAGPRNLALAAGEAGAKLVHISTDYVFDGLNRTPYCEWDAPAPKAIYGKSKLEGERYVSTLHPEHFIIRTAWLYGHDGKNFVKTIVRAAREKGAVRVVNDQRGSPTYANDLAHHILKLAVTDAFGLYHCAGGGECSRYDFALEIVRLAGVSCDVRPCATGEFPRPAPRPAYSALRNLALECSVGDGMRCWRDALAGYFAYEEGGSA